MRGFGDGGKKLVGELAARSFRVDKDRASVVDGSVRPLEVCVLLLLLAPQCEGGEVTREDGRGTNRGCE